MSFRTLKLTVGQLDENCYLIHDSKEAIIIDPGDEAEYISQKILDLEVTPTMIIATHGHFDHLQAVLPLQLAFNIPVFMHPADHFLLKNYRSSTEYFTDIDPGPPPQVTGEIKEGDIIHLGDETLRVIEVPGHTPGSVALYSSTNECVFVGDVLFEGGTVGRTDLSYSNKKELTTSIEKLLKLPKDTVVYAGHGGETTLVDFTSQYPLV